MTTAAREVLDACRGAVDELIDGVQGAIWRRRWITAVVLLRSIGHVLKSVDRKQGSAYAAAIDEAWDRLRSTQPEPLIFWEFILSERNNILKENRSVAGQGVTVYLGGDHPHEYHYVINSGPFAGIEQRDLLWQAIAWWESYLDAIDLAVGDGSL